MNKNIEISAQRRKRINRLKKMILTVDALLIIVPIIICVILIIRVNILEKQLSVENEIVSDKSELSTVNETDGSTDVVERNENVTDISHGSISADGSSSDLSVVSEQEGTYILNVEGTDSANLFQGLDADALADYYDNVVENEELSDIGLDQQIDENSDAVSDGIRRVYLTFDDGPSSNTEAILKILDEYDIKATFFVCGRTDDHSIEMYKEIIKRGHTLGMHSYSHVYDDMYASVDAFKDDLDRIYGLLYGVTGVKPFVYRFPGGSSNRVSRINIHDCIDVLNDRGITYYDWNSQTGDASKVQLSTQTLISNALTNVDRMHNMVILMHDAKARTNTVEALPLLIEKLMKL
ncbi:MAG: polysaccharide deacetylase, partial [Lachnospiraceae bacterium]|nr:polysaccharide deacetylase [Candidatus Merdinaster equi]